MATDTRLPLKRCRIPLLAASLLTAVTASAHAQSAESLRAAIHTANSYRVAANLTYLKVGSVESKLDVYQSRTATTPNPTLIWIHGGNWVGGSKEASTISLLPFLDMGWNVVNVEYRLLGVAPAPAAAEDCRCALGWIYEHAKDYNIDPNRLVISGNSAGGHLSLLTGMAPADVGLDSQCPAARNVKVAAIINWYGFPSLSDLVEGSNARAPVGAWLANAPNRLELAKRLSPMTYVRGGVPPIISVHGDADPTSPYEYAVRFHDALKKAGVPNELVTIPGGKHGGFTDDESLRIYKAITAFLTQQHIQKGTSAEP